MKHFTILKTARYLLNRHRRSDAGFNLVEVATVVIIAGILGAIIAPSWLSFTNRQRLRASQSNVFRAMQSAQTRAKGNRETWQVSFRTNGDNIVQWAIHSADIANLNGFSNGTNSGGIAENTWYSLEENITIDEDNSNIDEINPPNGGEGFLFNERGCPVTEIAEECTESLFSPTITFKHTQMGENTRRCVKVDTLLGAMRTTEDDDCTPQ